MRVILNNAQNPPTMSDLGEVWMASIFLGAFEGGEIQIPGLSGNHEVLKGHYGDVLLMKNVGLIEMAPFRGKRYQLDFFVAR